MSGAHDGEVGSSEDVHNAPVLTLFSATHVVHGRAPGLVHRVLSDVLDDQTEAWILLTEAGISPLGGEMAGPNPMVAVSREAVVLALQEPNTGLPPGSEQLHAPTVNCRVTLIMGPLIVDGLYPILEGSRLRDQLIILRNRVMVIRQASVTLQATGRQIAISDVAVVNVQRVVALIERGRDG